MPVYRRGTFRTQFDGSAKAGSNCTPASVANGAREATDGAYDHSGGDVRRLVSTAEETNPKTPGWSLGDAALAMQRAGVPFQVRAGQGWTGVRAARAAGLMVVLQGDSDQFANSTCSGAFDGDHCVVIHPENNGTKWLLGDPICQVWRWEEESVIRSYAAKLNSAINFGVFLTPVRKLVEENHMAQLTITSTVPKEIVIPIGAKALLPDGSDGDYTFTKSYTRFSPYAVGSLRAYFAQVDGKQVIRLVSPSVVRDVPVDDSELRATKAALASERATQVAVADALRPLITKLTS